MADSGRDGSVGDSPNESRLRLASLIGLVGQVLIWAVGLPVFIWLQSTTHSASRLGSNLGPHLSTIPGWSSPGWFYLSMGSLTVGFMLGMVSFTLFYRGFRAAARSAPDFRTQSGPLFVGSVGYLLLAVATVVFAAAMASAIGSAGPAAALSGSAGLNMDAVWTGVILLSVGGFLGIVGTAGLALANWRAGRHYADSGLKVGAILTMLPFVAVAGQALLLRGHSTVAPKFRGGWATASETSGGQTSSMGSAAPSPPAPPRSRHWRKAHPPPQ
jgi:hypothetical protein